MREIYFFGDSIAYGQWDDEGGWVNRLRREIDAAFIGGTGPKTLVYNLGIPGDTAADLLARIEGEMAARYNPANPCAIIFVVGMNDAHFSTSLQRDRFSQEEFERNIGRLIGIARKFTKQIGFVGLNPIEDARVQPLPWNTEKSYSTGRVQSFNAILQKVAAEEGLGFVDVWADWAKSDHLTHLCDGLHPNSGGHARIAALVKASLGSLMG